MAAPATPQPPQTPSAAPSYTPIVTDFLRLVRAPFAPRGVFEEQRDDPTFWTPWVVASVLFMVLAFLSLPIVQQGMQLAAAARGTPVPASAQQIGKTVAVIGAPVGLLIGALIAAIVLYAVLMVAGAQARFKGLLTVSIFPVGITFLQQLVSVIAIRARGVETAQSAQDLQLSFGLDLLVSPEYAQAHRGVAAFLKGIGPFEIWALVICVVGLMALEKVPKNKAWAAAVVGFVVGLCIRAGLALVMPGQ